MRCARREAGPPDPAAAPRGRVRKLLPLLPGSTGGRAAVPARSGRSPWRRLALLPVLALLGALSPSDSPAQVTRWSSMLTVGESGDLLGCDNDTATILCDDLLWPRKIPFMGGRDHYYVSAAYTQGSTFNFVISSTPGYTPVNVRRTMLQLRLCVEWDGIVRNFDFHMAANRDTGALTWPNADLPWSAGDGIRMTIQTLMDGAVAFRPAE